MTDELLKAATHEAGHCLALLRSGRRLGPVTVKQGARWSGSTHYSVVPVERGAWTRLDPTMPVACWPGPVRRKFDVTAVCAAAGDAAERLLWWPGQGDARRLPSAVEAAGDIIITEPSRREELIIAAARADTKGRTDGEILAFLAESLYPDAAGVAVSWLAWVRESAELIIAQGSQRVQRLAAVLSDRGTMSGKAVRAVLTEPVEPA
jgi:hypothetical protein